MDRVERRAFIHACVCVCVSLLSAYLHLIEDECHAFRMPSVQSVKRQVPLCLYRAVQAGLLTPLTFARHRLNPLAAFTSGAYFLHNGSW